MIPSFKEFLGTVDDMALDRGHHDTNTFSKAF